MPAPWRPGVNGEWGFVLWKFQSQARCQPRGDLQMQGLQVLEMISFNLKRDASPVATSERGVHCVRTDWFQSQARCQPRGDYKNTLDECQLHRVSISSEMPAPWRLLSWRSKIAR